MQRQQPTTTLEPAIGTRGKLSWCVAGYGLVCAVIAPFAGPRGILAGPISVGLLFAAVDGLRRYGARSMTILFATTVLIGNLLEDVSIQTGFPFGSYYHTTGPKIIDVPISVGPTYFAIGYVAWRVAGILLGSTDGGPGSTLLQPMVAAVLATMYDLTIDPIGSTIARFWIWRHGGAYFGVPVSNFLGWLLTVYLFLQVFAIVVRRRAGVARIGVTATPDLIPVLVYLAMGMTAVFAWLHALGSSGRIVADGAGHEWSVRALYAGTMLVSLFTVCFIALLAAALTRLVGLGSPVPRAHVRRTTRSRPVAGTRLPCWLRRRGGR